MGFLLIVLGNKNKYCLAFGLILLGVSLMFYALHKSKLLEEEIKEVGNEMKEVDQEDFVLLGEYAKYKNKLKGQKRSLKIAFLLFAALIIICGFASLF